MEHLRGAEQYEGNTLSPEFEKESVENKVLDELVLERVGAALEDELASDWFTENEIERFEESLRALPEAERKAALSTPQSLWERTINYFKDRDTSPEDLVQELAKRNSEYGFTFGFHVSNHDIKPTMKNNLEWQIQGVDVDDRDGRPMAYYSLDYKNLYRDKRAKFLYVVRAETGPQSSHKFDKTTHWGRASSLAVIDKFHLQDVDEQVERIAASLTEERRKEAA